MNVRDKVVIVTGASREGQLGEHLANQFAHAGALVVAAARSADNVKRVADTITANGGRATAITMDGTKEDDVARMTEQTINEYGRVDVLVNLAGGLTRFKPVAELDLSDWHEEVDNNLKTAFLCSRAVIPHMMDAKQGRIINFASAGALNPMGQMAPYNCAKAGVIALTKTLAQELKKQNVQVNALAPGLLQTKSNLEAMKPSSEDLEKKWVTLDAVTNVALFLASDVSKEVTGQVIPVVGKAI